MALTRIHRLGLMNARVLYDAVGSAAAILDHRKDIRALVPDASDRLVEALVADSVEEAMLRAEAELEFAEQNHIRVLCLGDAGYPQALSECRDAPLALYYLGSADLNSPRIVSMVGTRRITPYGKELCQQFVHDLQAVCPDVVIVSGLAYGVDIHCHRAALSCGLPTVGVLAHGLDTLYPSLHRRTAAEMVRQGGGLLTEYMSRTNADKANFVHRNRIVAGLSGVTVVVESAARGGALITARLAQDYNRDVCAFPGRVTDAYSEGCNRLISTDAARLITSVDDFLRAVNWPDPREKRKKEPQMELFPELSDEERLVMESLKDVDSKSINQIVVDTNLPLGRVSAALFELEMKGLTVTLGGARYKRKRI